MTAIPGPVLLCRRGDSLSEAGRLEEAAACYRDALAQDPGYAEAHSNLASVLADLGRLAEAEKSCNRAIEIDPGAVIARHNLGLILRRLGRQEEAERSFLGAIACRPDFVPARYELANMLSARGQLEEADAAFRDLVSIHPSYVEAHNNHGTVLARLGRFPEAEQSYRQALMLRPNHAVAHNNLGNLLRELGRHEDAELSYRRAIECNPALADVHGHHANALLDLARLEEAELDHRRAVGLAPQNPMLLSNLLLFLNYVPGRLPSAVLSEHREFGRRFGNPGELPIHANSRDAERRLRVGYVSGDLREHSVARFIEPVLVHHNRSRFEIFCYYNFPRTDEVTRRLMSHADHWRDIHALDDEALVRVVRSDAIDVLVDLSGHTGGNRLTAFARKPAPVQVTWLGYPSTSGLQEMDYRLTDGAVDPPGESDAWYVEKLVRLPGTMWCFMPDPRLETASREVSSPNGPFTFGSFNYFAKLNCELIALWSRLLACLPNARLLITRVPGEDTALRLRQRFESAGVARERLELHGIVTRERYAELVSRTHVALDTIPYAGTTTTCDVLWMGVPVVTLAGEGSAARSGKSLLDAVGLQALVGSSATEYLDIAESLARDSVRLEEIRCGLSQRIRRSPLADAEGFTRGLEAAFRNMWREWVTS